MGGADGTMSERNEGQAGFESGGQVPYSRNGADTPAIERLDAASTDLARQNVEKLAELFPDCVTEGPNGGGLNVDFDLLRQALSDRLVEGPTERYRLDWPGKREAMLLANTPTTKTLRPCREESVYFDTTRNLFIEGDNLEALKILQETYLGKVKMIYIDPPYNTGKDFIYKDKFARSAAEELEASGQLDEEGGRLVANTEANGRFHSDWLSMMLPRLKLARRLLRDDGCVCISLDESEVANGALLLKQIFGEQGHMFSLNWQTKRGARGVPPRSMMMENHEYVLIGARNADDLRFVGETRDESDFSNPDNDRRGLWRSESIRATGAQDNWFTFSDPQNGTEFYGNWAFSEDSIKNMISDGLIIFPPNKSGTPRQKKFIDSYRNDSKALVSSIGWHSTERATNELMGLFENEKVFDFPKPLSLIGFLVKQLSNSGDVIVDLFAGAAPIAETAMSISATSGARTTISIQYPEEVGGGSARTRFGFHTIAALAKERIRRAGTKHLDEHPDQRGKLDVGFRVLKVDASNYHDTHARADEVADAALDDAERQSLLDGMISHIKDDRSDEDLLFGALLAWGVDVTLPLRHSAVEGRDVILVDAPESADEGAALIACFARDVDVKLAEALAVLKPLRVVFRDDGFVDDATKENVASRFAQLAPDTSVRVL